MAKAVAQKVSGRLLWENEAKRNGRTALLLTHPKPDAEAEELLFLRFAFVIMGTEAPLFPSFLIDDWGGEVRGTAVYTWVKENGNQFPRAEIFGFDGQGNETQRFVRELELYARLPCAAYPDRETPLPNGTPIHAILLPDAAVTEPVKIKRPSELKRPLTAARVTWWQVPLTLTTFDFSLLDETQAPDFI
ncbi:MAG: hypothetical protein H6654_00945 [Ardenticatenaceae bacterium]|nr:hypothetical protein [Anaerolineales bacterium]MCB8940753.1 hypothetical protein [Ardenticatenaceae bacterium]MCB8972092.1 hypothetical protein [Ardenticatenaceae bacterium]